MSIRLLGKKACGYREYRDCHIVTSVNGVKNQKSCARMLMQTKVSMHVETVCLLSKLHEAKHHVSVTLDMDEMDLTAAERKATYEEIKKYVVKHNDGMKVSNLYIEQIKQKHGIIERENYNKPKSEKGGQPECPKEKEIAIEEALKYFQMIPSES